MVMADVFVLFCMVGILAAVVLIWRGSRDD